MGAKPSVSGSTRRGDSFSRSSSKYSPRRAYNSETSSSSEPDHNRMTEFQKKYGRILDKYNSLEQVTQALVDCGLESSNLIVAIDFTKSNEWTGMKSFKGKSLHHLDEHDDLNPYEHAISIIGKTLSRFDEDNLIPCFGFGDVTTHDRDVFSFYPDHSPCYGFEQALNRYREVVKGVKLAGPTSFGPIIETAIGIVDSSGGQYHVLLIIADGQVTRSVDTRFGQFSPQESSTIDAIVEASKYPLSIIVVGVGDGPWDTMKQFDDNIPARDFDNIQFVNFTEIMSKNIPLAQREAEFALWALMEIPSQYKATLELGLLGRRRGNSTKDPLPPPSAANLRQPYSTPPPYPSPVHRSFSTPTVPSTSSTYCPPSPNPMNCPVCCGNKRDVVLGCGHTVCYECDIHLSWCPVCLTEITNRIRLSQNSSYN
ncbi:E3 ubiquitin-protein ligase RGLG3-like isoform X2 [Henckelia pumila]|uniref:E3 ubiquitin-protein ligase RGLG3-like isoform X2 n=1 Tax=Henckelia pumila TaxID=405737 RepID=UPI003C6E8D3A